MIARLFLCKIYQHPEFMRFVLTYNFFKIFLHRFQQHVPFRESKLTHYFQSFFNGKGKICMIVNISQCFFAYDETLNVLKFSAIAQKVNIIEFLQNFLSLLEY